MRVSPGTLYGMKTIAEKESGVKPILISFDKLLIKLINGETSEQLLRVCGINSDITVIMAGDLEKFGFDNNVIRGLYNSSSVIDATTVNNGTYDSPRAYGLFCVIDKMVIARVTKLSDLFSKERLSKGLKKITIIIPSDVVIGVPDGEDVFDFSECPIAVEKIDIMNNTHVDICDRIKWNINLATRNYTYYE